MTIWLLLTVKVTPLYRPATKFCNGVPPMLSNVQLNCDCLAH